MTPVFLIHVMMRRMRVVLRFLRSWHHLIVLVQLICKMDLRLNAYACLLHIWMLLKRRVMKLIRMNMNLFRSSVNQF